MTIPFLCQTGLKINHGFYYQIQGQLAIFPTRTVHLCVYTHSDFQVFEIHKDEAFSSEIAFTEKHVYASYDQYY